MKILIYSPSNQRAVDQQTQAELLIGMGHEVFLLTWLPKGILHKNFEELGAKSYSSSHLEGRSIFFFLQQVYFLIKFCRQNKIDVVFAHLQGNALVLGLARIFLNARCFYFRHNSDYFELLKSKKDKIINNLANKFSSEIVAVSEKVKAQLMKEGVSEQKISRINYCYNFSQYEKTRSLSATTLRQKFNTDFMLLAVARFHPLKRFELMFEVVKRLNTLGIDCKLVCVGDGEQKPEFEKWIADNNMTDNIILTGFALNTVDYFEACDMLIHLSSSEASSHVVKEAGMCRKPVLVCKEVGDFEDYIHHGINSFLVNKDNPVDEAVEILSQVHNNKQLLNNTGSNLYHSVIDNFSMESVKKYYEKLLAV